MKTLCYNFYLLSHLLLSPHDLSRCQALLTLLKPSRSWAGGSGGEAQYRGGIEWEGCDGQWFSRQCRLPAIDLFIYIHFCHFFKYLFAVTLKWIYFKKGCPKGPFKNT